jgi:adenylate cyclase
VSDEGKPTHEQVVEQLDRILASQSFRTTGRLSDFVRFVVQETLAGNQHQIKGYTVATRVFERPGSFDAKADPVVRIQAGRLRRRLAEYYSKEGATDPIRIQIPKGSYVPEFLRADEVGDLGRRSKAAAEGPAGSRFEGPSVAVLPFVYIGDVSDVSFLADGITEELVVSLSRFQGLAVIGRQSTLRYKQSDATVEQVSRDLGVRFVVTGSVRKIGDTIRVAAQLTDAVDSSQRWADTLQRDLTTAGLFEIQDEITHRVVASIGDEYGAIPRQLTRETRGKPPHELSAYEASLQFYQYNAVTGLEAHSRARRALERAVEVDPEYALAWAQLGELYLDSQSFGYDPPDNPIESARSCVRRAIALDPLCQQAHVTMAYIQFVCDELEEAVREAETAIELNPNSSYLVGFSAFLIGLSGNLERGREIIEDVERLNPHHPGWLRLVAMLCHLERREYDEALHEARKFRTPRLAWDPLVRAATAGLAGNETVAVSAYREYTELFPEVAGDPVRYIKWFVRPDEHVSALLEGLEKAKGMVG